MRKLTLAIIATTLIFFGAGCLNKSNVIINPITLEYWRVNDAPNTLTPIIDAYRKLHPNITINVRSFRADQYEKTLLEALAENRGPDLMSIPNVWLTGWQAKLLPLPAKTVVPSQIIDPASKKVAAINYEKKSMSIKELRDNFVEAVQDDVVKLTTSDNTNSKPTNAIWGLPYSLDTLALFYNVDLLKHAKITEPPKTWTDLQEQVKTLTQLEKDGVTIKQAGAAIGTAKNVRHYADLLVTLMAQNGAQLTDANGTITFHRTPAQSSEQLYPPAIEAWLFYQSFSQPGMSTYTWNDSLPDSMDAFIAGKTAFYFGYPYDRTEISTRAPQLNFDVTSMPQLDLAKPKDVATYPIETVSKKTAHPNEAWDFIQFAADQKNVAGFLTATSRPTALRGLINEQLNDPKIKPFVLQILTAESWYRGKNWSATEQAFSDLIYSFPSGDNTNYGMVLSNIVNQINQTYY